MAERDSYAEAIEEGRFVADLGDDHWLLSWYVTADGAVPGVDRATEEREGAIVLHRQANGHFCPGTVWFRPGTRPSWTVESWDPLTISPSLLCHCGDHGFIREGKWVRA